MTNPKLTFKESRARYAQFDRCDHEYTSTFTIPKTDVELTDCQVCSETLDRKYLTNINS